MSRRPPTVRDEIRQRRPFRSAGEEAAVGLLLTAEVLRRRLARAIERGGITQQQYNVLRILRGTNPQPLATLEIAERMIERTPGVTRLLDRLERKGLVERDRGREDRRCVYCNITEPGLALLARLDGPVLQAVDSAFAVLKTTEIRDLGELLDRLRDAAHSPTDEEKS